MFPYIELNPMNFLLIFPFVPKFFLRNYFPSVLHPSFSFLFFFLYFFFLFQQNFTIMKPLGSQRGLPFYRSGSYVASASWWASSMDRGSCRHLNFFQQHNCSWYFCFRWWKGNFFFLSSFFLSFLLLSVCLFLTSEFWTAKLQT